MAIAYCLITTKPGTEKAVAENLRKDREITEMHAVFGDYDIIFKVEVEDQKKLGDYLSSITARKDKRIIDMKILHNNFL